MSIPIFSPEECASMVAAFDAAEKTDENGQKYYRNSSGVYNLPATLAYVDRVTDKIKHKYPGLKFANSYTRTYGRHSFLGLHTDRPGLDITLSVCIEDRNNLDWPLCISMKTYEGEWKDDTQPESWQEEHIQVHTPLGYGAFMEGRTFPHWRDELLCGESQRTIYVFYHWTIEEALPTIPEPKLLDNPSYINIDGQNIQVAMQLKHPRVVLFNNFLSLEECNEMIEGIKDKVLDSTVIDNKTGSAVKHPGRTSSGSFYQRGQTPLIDRLEARISKLLNWPVDRGEGFQILRYENGQQYKPHFDYFDLAHGGTAELLKKGGQRVATLILYLSTPIRGGSTIFPDANSLEILPQAGSALFFSYDKPDHSTATLHGGSPVIEGEKWIATKWLHESRY